MIGLGPHAFLVEGVGIFSVLRLYVIDFLFMSFDDVFFGFILYCFVGLFFDRKERKSG